LVVRAALYARVSTLDQHPENQLAELQRYIERRGWKAVPFIDKGISGAKDSRPALNAMLQQARRRQIDVVVCWRLDRLGRNLKHLVTVLDELQALGVAFVSLNEGIDATTSAGKLQMHILAAIAEFERARIVERVNAGLARARAKGTRLGRPLATIPVERVLSVAGLRLLDAAKALGVSRSTMKRWRKGVQKSPPPATPLSPILRSKSEAV
jgi:DNA invertase Pin-like site-specific DNA recombinase